MKYAIGIDVGTSGTKTVIFDTEGRKIASATVEYPLYQPENGWAEQNPTDWKNAAIETLAAVMKKSGIDKNDVVGIGLSGQMHGLVMLDKDNEVLGRSIIWADQRTAKECEEIESLVTRKRLIEITANPALTGFTASKIMWVKKHKKEIYERCRHILLPKDYIRLVLTGEYATDVSDASGMQLLDVPKRQWSKELLDTLGIDISLLGKVYESQEITGYITEEIATLTGLRAGTPVIAGAGDNAAAAVGLGIVREGKAFTTIGTSGVVFAHTDSPTIDKNGRVHTFCHAVKGKWHVMGVIQSAGLSLRWLRDNICDKDVQEAKVQGVDPYVIMDKNAEESVIGANRLLYLPYLMGERTPHLDPNARGCFIGLSAIHSRSDMTRAVLEGVCYALKDSLEILSDMGMAADEMTVCGGGARSDLWRRMLADIYGVDCCRTESDEGPALGAAILAMVGAGVYESVESACDAVVRIRDTVHFDIEAHRRYMEFYEIYRGLYGHLKDDFDKLSRL